MNPDVLIVGGGPAGIATALTLLRHGLRPLVLDKARFPRDKTCGDGLTTSALRQFEALGFDPRVLPSWKQIDKTHWRAPSGHVTTLSVPNDGVRCGVVKRKELDAAFLHFSESQGVEVLHETAFATYTTTDQGVAVTSKDGRTFTAHALVAADGAWSPVRKAMSATTPSLPPDTTTRLAEIHAFRQYATNVTGIAKDDLWVSFERDLLPGYFWAFPTSDGGANIGFGVYRKANESLAWMNDRWEELLTRPHIVDALGADFQRCDTRKAWPLPARIPRQSLHDPTGRVLFVGDAARAIDPLTGEGIGQALHTGTLAATALATHGPRGAASTYRKSVVRGIQIDNSFARMLSNIVAFSAGAELAVRGATWGPQRGRYAIRWVLEDHPRAALLTPWRWRERRRTQGGAFQNDSSD